MRLMARTWKSMVPGAELPDPGADYRQASRAGQYKVSALTLYQGGGSYLPFSAVTEVLRDKGSVHVTGCCAGGVLVERVVVATPAGKRAFLFDTVRTADRVAGLCRAGAGLDG